MNRCNRKLAFIELNRVSGPIIITVFTSKETLEIPVWLDGHQLSL